MKHGSNGTILVRKLFFLIRVQSVFHPWPFFVFTLYSSLFFFSCFFSNGWPCLKFLISRNFTHRFWQEPKFGNYYFQLVLV